MGYVLAAVAILLDSDNRVLITKRKPDQLMGDLWEFPGGKIEEGETPEEALKREIKEEIGIDMGCHAPFYFISEAREGYHLLVMSYICREWKGIPSGAEGQEAKWVYPNQLKDYSMLPSNDYLNAMLRDYVNS